MKILLIKPRWPYPIGRDFIYNRIWPPLCLSTCAALLEKDGHEVKILDAHAERLPNNGIGRRIAGFDKVFLTSSTLDRWQCPNIDIQPFLSAAAVIRNATPELFVMGYHGSINPRWVIQATGAKAVIRNEPEITVQEICRQRPFAEIEGIAYICGKEIISNKDRGPLRMEGLPLPAYHLLKFKRYYYEILGGNFALFEGSRGCPYRCSFCSKFMYGNAFRQKPPEVLVLEVEEAVKKHGVRTGYFIDLDFAADKEWAAKFCNLLAEKKFDFQWCCQARADRVDEYLLKGMKQAKCALVHYGIETGSAGILETVHKDATLQQLEKGVRLTRMAGLKSLCIFILGLSNEPEEEGREAEKFARRLNPCYIFCHFLVPYHDPDFFVDAASRLPKKLIRIIRGMLLRFYLEPRRFLAMLAIGFEVLLRRLQLSRRYLG